MSITLASLVSLTIASLKFLKVMEYWP